VGQKNDGYKKKRYSQKYLIYRLAAEFIGCRKSKNRGILMKNKINKYLIYDILGTLAYGLILYFGFTWLAGFALLYAYLWNFALIIFAVALDKYFDTILKSDKMLMLMKEKYGSEKTALMLTGGFLSFKTLIYLFYLFILIASQIIDFNPALIGENLVNFIHANNYSILFLLAFDTVIGQFSRDRERMKKIAEKLKESSGEDGSNELL
jgi:hypothetical protein